MVASLLTGAARETVRVIARGAALGQLSQTGLKLAGNLSVGRNVLNDVLLHGNGS